MMFQQLALEIRYVIDFSIKYILNIFLYQLFRINNNISNRYTVNRNIKQSYFFTEKILYASNVIRHHISKKNYT